MTADDAWPDFSGADKSDDPPPLPHELEPVAGPEPLPVVAVVEGPQRAGPLPEPADDEPQSWRQEVASDLRAMWDDTRSWLSGWAAKHRRQRPLTERDETLWETLARHPDPYAALIDWRREILPRQALLGFNEWHNFVTAEPDHAVLVVGPMGSQKTASLAIPNILLAPGAVLSINAKQDTFIATARLRSRFGEVWVLDSHGRGLPGAKTLRCNLLTACQDKREADKFARRLVQYLPRNEYDLVKGGADNPHFQSWSEMGLSSLLFISQNWRDERGQRRGMDWILRIVKEQRSLTISVGQMEKAFLEVPDRGLSRALVEALHPLETIAACVPDERSGHISTINRALRPFFGAGAIETFAGDGDFDFDRFVRGEPDATVDGCTGIGASPLSDYGIYPKLKGRFDSIYCCSASAEDTANFFVSEVEYRLRNAQMGYSDECELNGLPRPMPLTISNDEAGSAVPTQLLDFLPRSRAYSFIFIMGVQNVKQMEFLWGKVGEGLTDLFPCGVYTKGIRDADTLNYLTMLAGKEYIDVVTHGGNDLGVTGTTPTQQRHPELVDRIRPDQVSQGHPEWPDAAYVVEKGYQPFYVDSTPYFRGVPYPALIVNAIEHTVTSPSRLPIPQLARDGDYSHLNRLGLAERYYAAADAIRQQGAR